MNDREIISDIAHSIKVDGYTSEQKEFLTSIVARLGCTTPPLPVQPEDKPVGKLIPCQEGWFADIDNPPPTNGIYEIMPLYTFKPSSGPRQPLTKNQRFAVKTRANQAMIRSPNLAWNDALVFETEAAHGIGAKP